MESDDFAAFQEFIVEYVVSDVGMFDVDLYFPKNMDQVDEETDILFVVILSCAVSILILLIFIVVVAIRVRKLNKLLRKANEINKTKDDKLRQVSIAKEEKMKQDMQSLQIEPDISQKSNSIPQSYGQPVLLKAPEEVK